MTDTPTTDAPESGEGSAGEGLSCIQESPPPAPVLAGEAAELDRLAVLEASARAAWSDVLNLSRQGGERLLDVAATVAEAGALSTPEEWIAWLDRAGVPRAAVHRVLELHRLRLTCDALEQLGGVVLAALWAGEARLPAKGEVLAVTLGEWEPGRTVPVCYVWRPPEAPEAFCAGRVDLSGTVATGPVTRAPLTVERDVWGTVWHLLGERFGDMVFRPIRSDVEHLVERLEARRQDALRTDLRVVH